MLRIVLNSKPFVWAILAIPAVLMAGTYARGETGAMDLLHPSGETSARLMIAAMMLGPLAALIGSRRWLSWLIQRRRALGVAAFGYALLHLAFYVIDMQRLDDMLAEIDAPGIWTGWLAFLLMLPPALASNEAAVRALRRNWKTVQRLLYAVALLTAVHWALLSYTLVPAAIHFAPLALLHILRFTKVQQRRKPA